MWVRPELGVICIHPINICCILLHNRDIVLSLSASDILTLTILLADKDKTMSLLWKRMRMYHFKCRTNPQNPPFTSSIGFNSLQHFTPENFFPNLSPTRRGTFQKITAAAANIASMSVSKIRGLKGTLFTYFSTRSFPATCGRAHFCHITTGPQSVCRKALTGLS